MGLFFGFTGLLSWSLSDLFVKHTLSKEPPWFLNFWTQFFGGTFLLVLGFLLGWIPLLSWASLSWIVLLAGINVFGMTTFYKAVQKKGVALSLPVIYCWPVFTVILSVIFFKEVPSLFHLLGMGIIIVGLFMVTMNKASRYFIDPSFLLAFFSMLSWAIFYVIIREPSALYGEFWITGGVKLMSSFIAFPILASVSTPRTDTKKIKHLWLVVLIGILDGIGLLAVTKGVQMGNVAVVTGIASACPILVALLGVLLFKEKVTRLQAFGIGVSGLGLLLLTIR